MQLEVRILGQPRSFLQRQAFGVWASVDLRGLHLWRCWIAKLVSGESCQHALCCALFGLASGTAEERFEAIVHVLLDVTVKE
jgi:hypothetical protein